MGYMIICTGCGKKLGWKSQNPKLHQHSWFKKFIYRWYALFWEIKLYIKIFIKVTLLIMLPRKIKYYSGF